MQIKTVPFYPYQDFQYSEEEKLTGNLYKQVKNIRTSHSLQPKLDVFKAYMI